MAAFISSTASSALLPCQGAPPACAASPLKRVFDGDQSATAAFSPAHTHAAADVSEQNDIYILEYAGTNVIGLCAQKLLGYTRPDLKRTREFFLAP